MSQPRPITPNNFLTNLKFVRRSLSKVLSVRDTHGGGWSRNINARYLHTLMVYL